MFSDDEDDPCGGAADELSPDSDDADAMTGAGARPSQQPIDFNTKLRQRYTSLVQHLQLELSNPALPEADRSQKTGLIVVRGAFEPNLALPSASSPPPQLSLLSHDASNTSRPYAVLLLDCAVVHGADRPL